jgi:hypothetical protein
MATFDNPNAAMMVPLSEVRPVRTRYLTSSYIRSNATKPDPAPLSPEPLTLEALLKLSPDDFRRITSDDLDRISPEVLADLPGDQSENLVRQDEALRRSSHAHRRLFEDFSDEVGGGARLTEWFDLYPGTDFFPSPMEIRRMTRFFVDLILASWGEVVKIVTKYELVIRNRWAKKTVEERRAILLQAWPDIPKSHRPDMECQAENGEAFNMNPFRNSAPSTRTHI